MPGDFFIKMTIGGLVIAFFVTYALAATYHVGKEAEKGMSLGSEILQAVISIMIALGVAFSLGQELPYVQLFEWFHSLMDKRQPCC
jgi:cellobiose-specific phosphotransferase system component IIC